MLPELEHTKPTSSTEDNKPITVTEDTNPTTVTEDNKPTTSTEDSKPTTSTEEPKTTTVIPPYNFDGLSFLGGILLAVGVMILLFIAYKYFGHGRANKAKGSYNKLIATV